MSNADPKNFKCKRIATLDGLVQDLKQTDHEKWKAHEIAVNPDGSYFITYRKVN